MNIYLAGSFIFPERLRPMALSAKYLLESFYYIKPWQHQLINEHFMLDSGAFTFMNSHKGNVDWDKYVEDYANFINKHDVKLFFELDIDAIIGLQKVERLRRRLESLTGKKPITVWHKSRGRDYFIDMVKKYDYVAIGGIAMKDIKPGDYKYFPWFIEHAHKNSSKIHALGFTNTKLLKKYPFDSVDSSSWNGSRFGTIYEFSNGVIKSHKRKNSRITGSHANAYEHNFRQWLALQRYGEINL